MLKQGLLKFERLKKAQQKHEKLFLLMKLETLYLPLPKLLLTQKKNAETRRCWRGSAD